MSFVDKALVCDPLFRKAAGALGIFENESFTELLFCLPEVANDFLASGEAIFFDAREPSDFAESHVDGAHLVPTSAAVAAVDDPEGPLLSLLLENPESTVIVYSDNGGDGQDGLCCARLAHALRNSPHIEAHRVLRLFGGLNSWKVRGFPVVGNPHPIFAGGTGVRYRASAGFSDLVSIKLARRQERTL